SKVLFGNARKPASLVELTADKAAHLGELLLRIHVEAPPLVARQISRARGNVVPAVSMTVESRARPKSLKRSFPTLVMVGVAHADDLVRRAVVEAHAERKEMVDVDRLRQELLYADLLAGVDALAVERIAWVELLPQPHLEQVARIVGIAELFKLLASFVVP